MKRSVLLLSGVLLVFVASAQADGLSINYASVSVTAVQFSPYGPSALLPRPSVYLIPTPIYGLSPIMVLSPVLSPHLVVISPIILVNRPYIQPSLDLVTIGAESSTATSQRDTAISIITNMR